MRGRDVLTGFALVVAVASIACGGQESSSADIAGSEASRTKGSLVEREPLVLFDGATLDGWTTVGGRYDGHARWSVEDGALTGRTGEQGEGGLIYTTRSFTSFDLELECKLDYPYDSGVFVRMLPPTSGAKGLQVTLDHREGGEIAAIYADAFLAHNKTAVEHFRKDEWNTVRVRCTGLDPLVEVWINGEHVTRYQLPPGTPGFATRGLIGLQVHGADAEAQSRRVQFRGIRLQELDVFATCEPEGKRESNAATTAGPIATPVEAESARLALTDAARDAGWRDLFEGGFTTVGTAEGYRIDTNSLEVPADGSGHIVTRADFTDYRLRFDFKIAEHANSGLFLRGARAGGDPAFSGCEVQIIDDFNWEARTQSALAPHQKTGALYAAVPAGPDKEYAPPGQWNRMEVLQRGTRLAVALNGRLLFDVDTSALDVEPPFAERAPTGFIGFQRYGADGVVGPTALWVRNAFVQPLAPLSISTEAAR